MSFAWPFVLWLLLVPLAILVREFLRRSNDAAAAHPKILRAEAGARSLELASPGVQPAARRSRPRGWLCIGLALVIAALARPQWGRLEEPVFDQSREILLAIDLSRSMLTPDVAPSRLARAKLLIQSLLEKLQGERVGLAVFSGTAFLQSPLSADYEILSEFLPALGPDFLPEGGTNYRALINTAIAAFGTSGTADRFLIVLSDGEATDDDWTERMPELKQKGIRVIGLGIGTVAGGMIPDGTGGFVKDERGAVVLSRLENGTLQRLAQATSGVYRDASIWLDLAGLIKETVDAGQRGKFIEKNTVRLVERFQWPLAFGFWCLLVSLFSEFPVRPRPRDIKLAAQPAAPKSAAEKLAVAALVLLFTCHLSLVTRAAEGSASPAAPLSRIVGRVSAADARTARDWSELGHETVIWGSRLQSEQQPVPAGPVHDALAAVDSGSALDPAATDWPKLRQDLEALLQKPEEQKQPPNQQDQEKNQNQDQQQKQDSKQQQQNQPQSDQQKQQQDKKDQQKQDAQNQQSDEQKKPGESAFGDMQKKDEPPPPPPPESGTQKVGGASEKKEQPPEQTDPSLALPLQKLDQLRNQDSPAQLFQLMDGEKKPAQKKAGKDW